jgi:beta-1,4-mannosyltransferase
MADPAATTPGDAAARFRIVSSTSLGSHNPYIRLFYRALAGAGIRSTGKFHANASWLGRHVEEFDAVHFHWPEAVVREELRWAGPIYRIGRGPRARRMLRWASGWVNVLALRGFLRELRRRGKRIIWTCHNLAPHEGRSRPVSEAIRLVAASADLIITHDTNARDACRRTYAPGGLMVVMPHGNYEGVYPEARPAAVVRRDLGLPANGPVLSCVGQIRPYKGIELACEAVAQLGRPVSLLIAGRVLSQEYVRGVRSLVGGLPAGVLLPRDLTDQEFADVVGASDVILLPYRRATGSGAALAALTLGRGIVASNLPFFESLLAGHPDAGRTFTAGDARDCARAIRAYLSVPPERRHSAARGLAGEFAWPRLVEPVVRVIEGWCEEMGRSPRTPPAPTEALPATAHGARGREG